MRSLVCNSCGFRTLFPEELVNHMLIEGHGLSPQLLARIYQDSAPLPDIEATFLNAQRAFGGQGRARIIGVGLADEPPPCPIHGFDHQWPKD